MQIYRYQLSFKISKAKCLQRNSGCFLSLPSEFPSAAACSSEWLLNFFFQSLEAKFPLDGRTTLGFIAVTELLLAPGPQGGSANLVAGRTLYMVNTWGGICEKQCLNTLHGALPCCLPEKNILYIDIVYQYIKVFPYMGEGHNRQISCEIKMKSPQQSLCTPLFEEVQATSRCSISQWCFSHMSGSSNGCVLLAYQVTFPLFAYVV